MSLFECDKSPAHQNVRVLVAYDEDMFTFGDDILNEIDPQNVPQSEIISQQFPAKSNDTLRNGRKRKYAIIESDSSSDEAQPQQPPEPTLQSRFVSNFKIRNTHRPIFNNNRPQMLVNRAQNGQVTVTNQYQNNAESRALTAINGKYRIRRLIGKGTYGSVYEAESIATNQKVAIKRINFRLDTNYQKGMDFLEREATNLRNAKDCKHIMQILDETKNRVAKSEMNIDLVLEYCPHSLHKIISDTRISFNIAEIKTFVRQILLGLEYIHDLNIVHRDIKTENILLTADGVIKIGDFGLSRVIENRSAKVYTSEVVTLWYRAPELLLGERRYTNRIDVWSVGCVMAEFWYRKPILPGTSEFNQLTLISKLCGTINADIWPNVLTLSQYKTLLAMPGPFEKVTSNFLSNVHSLRDQHADRLFDKLLQLNPDKRCSAMDALDDEFFYSRPLPINLKALIERVNSKSNSTKN